MLGEGEQEGAKMPRSDPPQGAGEATNTGKWPVAPN